MLKSYVFDKLVKCCDNEMFLIIILYFCSIYSIFFFVFRLFLFVFVIHSLAAKVGKKSDVTK